MIRVAVHRSLMPPREQEGIIRHSYEMTIKERTRFAEQFVQTPIAKYLVRVNFPFNHWNEVLNSPHIDYTCEYVFIGPKMSKQELECKSGPISVTEIPATLAIDTKITPKELLPTSTDPMVSQTANQSPPDSSTDVAEVKAVREEPMERQACTQAAQARRDPMLSGHIKPVEALVVPSIPLQATVKQHLPLFDDITSLEEDSQELEELFGAVNARDLMPNLMQDQQLRRVYKSILDDDQFSNI